MATEKMLDRNPDNYTIGMPQVLFNPLPANGNFQRWIDCHALAHALFGVTNNAGQVVNAFGHAVGTPKAILAECYLGALDKASLGGDIATLDHTVSNYGYLETDRSIVLNRPYVYSATFDEPDVKNLTRYLVGEETNLGAPITSLAFPGTVFAGSLTPALTVFSRSCGNPANAVAEVMSLWTGAGADGLPPSGVYGFIIGGTNEEECVGEWANKRHWVAYGAIDFTRANPDKQSVTWTYLRPDGTAVGGVNGDDSKLKLNVTCLCVPDSTPVVNFCGEQPQWNASAVLAWSHYGWYGADEGFYAYSIVGSTMAFKRATGCAVLATVTEIGTSLIHVIPRCTLMPDGSMDFSADQWQQGTFKLSVQRDASAKYIDRKPASNIPYGYAQTFRPITPTTE